MTEDTMAWNFERNGLYSVRSAHRVAFVCSMARSFWRAAKEIVGIKLPDLHPLSWTKDLLSEESCSKENTSLIICGVWSLWSGRNARKHGREKWDQRAAVRHVASMLEDMVCSEPTQEVSSSKPWRRWSRPPEEWLKVNTDDAYSEASTSGASGAVLRNSQGVVLAAAAHSYNNLADVTMAEALAARDGLLLATEHGARRVILEIDNLPLMSLLRSNDGIRSNIAGVWHEVRELSRLFVAFEFSFVNREGNEAAHMCASMPSETSPSLSWSCSLPVWLVEIAGKECNASYE
ncbi:hypothetical protein HU200_060725 [Digitaria exilis]|uniref:RNase H type-1 domain-containing protein n=1 Tax=Digitaria exilis TaxID=1010633 RepID=A0A835DYK4_9POAL|nr:hypothetical protein HU200_060725 [Digitaria exilis]